VNLQEKVKARIRDVHDFPKEGIIFKDITSLFLHPELSKELTKAFVEDAKGLKLDAICAIDSRGFLLGTGIAQALDLPLILIRKRGKLPGKTISQSYDLEYGSATLEMHIDDLKPGSSVLIHDDLLATGGTAQAAAELIKTAGSQVSGFSFIVSLLFLPGMDRLKNYTNNIFTVASYK